MLAERWNVRLVAVVAPGGYGKSTALAQAIRDNDSDPTGIDAYARCRASQRSAGDIASDLLNSLGSDLSFDGDDVDAAVAALASTVADASPNDVSLHLDDVHLVADIVGGVDLLDGLLSDLPHNGHVVLSGRSMPSIRVTRLRAADQLVEVGPDDLAFDDAEVHEIAARHGRSADHVDASGWPALTRLALTSDEVVTRDYLFEEVIGSLGDDERLALACAVVAGSVDDELLSACGCSSPTAALLESVPLLVDYGDGQIGAHDLWHDVSDALVDDETMATIVEAVVERWSQVGEHYAAVDAATGVERWDLALAQIRAALAHGDVQLTAGQAERWTSTFPEDLRDAPELRLLSALRARIAGDFQQAGVEFEALVDVYRESDDLEGAAIVCTELAMLSWMLNDRRIWGLIEQWSEELVERGSQRVRRIFFAGDVVRAELRGDFARALQTYEDAGVDEELWLRHSSTLAMLVGDCAKAHHYMDRLLDEYPRPLLFGHARFLKWQCGDPGPFLEAGDFAGPRFDNRRNELLAMVFHSMIGASLGQVPDVEHVETLAWARGREQTYVALVHAVADLLQGDEASAASAFQERLDAIGLDDPLLRGEVLRFLPYAYVLSPRARDWIETDAVIGPLHTRKLELARTFVHLRADPAAEFGDVATNEEVLTWLPLPWAIEIAAQLSRRGDERGLGLAEYLADICGATAHVELRRLAAMQPDLADGAVTILASVPAPLPTPVRVDVSNGTTVTTELGALPITRQRVRQVIQLLLLRGEMQRSELLDLMWPDVEASKSRPNLRATLLHVRKALEPSRQSGEASFCVRLRGERVWIQRDPAFTSDLWDVMASVEAGKTAVDTGQDDAALAEYRVAFDLWSDLACADIRDIPGPDVELAAIDRSVVRAGCWVGERLLSRGEFDAAAGLAIELLQRDPYEERAHDVMIGACLGGGDLGAARRAIGECRSRLDELGVQPGSGTSMLIRRYERRSGASTVAPPFTETGTAG